MSATADKVYAPLPTTERGAKTVLNGDPKGKTFLYTRGKHVIVRDLENPINAYTYDEHPNTATVAKYAPSGFYICSGDDKGNVRIWDTTQETHSTKWEYRSLGGRINDIAWTEDSKRIVVGGNGSDTYGRAFLVDSGSSVGEISGHTKLVNSCDMKPNRPYRVVTAGEDTDCGFYAGPPFKLQHMNKESDKYVNFVRYAPDGSIFVTVDAGGKAFVYEGKEGKLMHELNGGEATAHKGGIYGCSFSADSKRIITASADKTVKMWDAPDNKLLTTFTFSQDVGDQQLGCLWQGDYLLSVGLNGYINFLDEANPGKPKRVIQGQESNVMALVVDGENYYAGGNDGRLSRHSKATGDGIVMLKGHANQVNDMAFNGGNVISCSVDDTVSFTPKGSDTLGDKVKLDSQPKSIATTDGQAVVVVSINHLTVLNKDGNKVSTTPISYDGLCGAMAPSGGEVAIGGADNKLHIYKVENETLVHHKDLDAKGQVCSVAYSPDGSHLACGDSSRAIILFNASTLETVTERWKYHTARVTCMQFSPDGKQLASGSLDTNIIIWNVEKPMKRITIKGAHPTCCINSIQWESETSIFTCGNDGCVRSFNVTSH